MELVSKAKQILKLRPKKKDLIAGAKYAAVSLPWTFNRMMMNTSSKGQQTRALNIAKGIVGQEMLLGALLGKGVKASIQRKSHRDEDLFDFCVTTIEGENKLDLKTLNYFTDYRDLGRSPLTSELIIQNSSYPGPDWRRFFPMLVPHTQIGQTKEAYCFAIASSIDFRSDIDTNRVEYRLTAFPYGNHVPFFCSTRLCQKREEVKRGFYIDLTYIPESLFNALKMDFIIVGEWSGNLRETKIKIGKNDVISKIGPFSCIDSFQISRSDYNKFYGQIEISVSKNDLKDTVLNSARRNINTMPEDTLIIRGSDFCNLILPSDYLLYVIGWTTKEVFLKKCREYTGWVWPIDKINQFENQHWSQLTEKDKKTLERTGFLDCIQQKPCLLKAGWMKTHGRGGGACCYVYPNIGKNGGVKETNLYILPKDLYTMSQLGK